MLIKMILPAGFSATSSGFKPSLALNLLVSWIERLSCAELVSATGDGSRSDSWLLSRLQKISFILYVNCNVKDSDNFTDSEIVGSVFV